MLGGLPPSAWPELASAAGAQAPVGGAQAEGLHHHHQQFGGGSVGRVRTVGVAAPTRSAAAESAAAKQMVLLQLPDLRQGHHMLLQGMGRSADGGGGGGDGGGSGRDVQALLKAAANSAAAGKKLRKVVLVKGADKINKSAGRNTNENELLP